MSKQKEFGDFQTPHDLATKVTTLVAELFGTPELVIEPTAGLGSFLKAARHQWGQNCRYEGYEINREYVDIISQAFAGQDIKIVQQDFFLKDWKQVLNRTGFRKVLAIGNPPWVTNSELSLLGSNNLPQKSNFQGLRGLDARTGKSNFDIAEWMLIQLIDAMPLEGTVAMLCKTSTARKVLRHFWKTTGGRDGSYLFQIDAKSSFDVAVDACLFITTGRPSKDRTARFYTSLDLSAAFTQFGFVDGDLVSNVAAYSKYRKFDGGSLVYTWRSGVKHDVAKVMEFSHESGALKNGLGQSIQLEKDFIYPLLKSSDLGNGRIHPRKSVLITQKHTSEDPCMIQSIAPKTWNYLMAHAEALDGRRSSIYQNRPRFSIFGIGEYSFAPWKVAISGLYKSFTFVVIPPFEGRPVMVDDTCYSIPCSTENEAMLLCEILSSSSTLDFLRSLVFIDSKRPITIDVLRRISLLAIAKHLGKEGELEQFIYPPCIEGHDRQMTLQF
jgi:hypothetical protein